MLFKAFRKALGKEGVFTSYEKTTFLKESIISAHAFHQTLAHPLQRDFHIEKQSEQGNRHATELGYCTVKFKRKVRYEITYGIFSHTKVQ